MATTKVRKKTPMRNKTALWRRMAVKGYGRRLRNAMEGTNHPAYPTQIIIDLMKRAGIATPVFDERMRNVLDDIIAKQNALKAAQEAQEAAKAASEQVTDVEVEPATQGA